MHLKKSERYELIQQVTAEFWKRWTEEVTPERVIRRTWHETGRNLSCGDIVLIHDKTPLKGKYLMGVVEEVSPGRDGLVRSCVVGYTVPNKRDVLGKYTGGRRISVRRSIQRLTLLLPVEEQLEPLQVDGDSVKVIVKE